MKTGAGDGNRTRVESLEGFRSTIELRPQNTMQKARVCEEAGFCLGVRIPPMDESYQKSTAVHTLFLRRMVRSPRASNATSANTAFGNRHGVA